MDSITTDVLIVGSGFGAAPPALRLAEAGLRVTVVEKGSDIDAPGDFRQTQDPSYFLRYYHGITGDNVGMTYIEGLGGGSGFYEMVSLRAPSPAFDVKDARGRSVYGAKQSLHLNYIPAARRAGAEYRTGVEATEIRRVREPGPYRARDAATSTLPARYEVVCRDASGRRWIHRAGIVILAGGTVGTARLLLASRRRLEGLSPMVGRRVAFNGGVKTAGLLGPEWPDVDMFTGQSHPGMVSYHFLESHGITIQAAKPLPLQAIAAARLRLDGDGREPAYWGEPHVRLMKDYRRRAVVIFALGLTKPTARLELDGEEPVVRLELTEELRDYYRRTKALLHSIYLDNGCRPLDVEFVDSKGMAREDVFFSTTHQLGSCPMSDSAARGVVDVREEAHGLPGLYVTDGAALPGSIA